MNFPLTGYGLTTQILVLFGYPTFRLILVRMAPTVIGFTPITVTPGYLILTGAGHHSITAAGAMMIITAGNGSLITNGDQPGLTGATAAATMAGRL